MVPVGDVGFHPKRKRALFDEIPAHPTASAQDWGQFWHNPGVIHTMERFAGFIPGATTAAAGAGTQGWAAPK